MSCLICKEDIDDEPSVRVRPKGLQTLIKCSLLRQDNLDQVFREVDTIILHEECRKKYTRLRLDKNGEYKVSSNCLNPKLTTSNFAFASINEDYAEYTKYLLSNANDTALNTPTVSTIKKRTTKKQHNSTDNIEATVSVERGLSQLSDKSDSVPVLNRKESEPDAILKKEYGGSQTESLCESNEIDPSKPFPFQHRCFICAKNISRKNFAKNIYNRVTREQTKDKIMQYLTRINTPKNQLIIQCIQDVDLVNVNAGYHKKCYNLVRLAHEGKGNGVRGRPERPDITAAMETIYKYIDGTTRTNFTVRELTDMLEDPPSVKTIITKMKNKYADKIYFTSVNGYSKVITIIKETTNIFDPNQGETECLFGKELYADGIKKEKKKGKKKPKEENKVEEKRKSSRLSVIENERKDTMKMNIEKEEDAKRRSNSNAITIKTKESKQILKVYKKEANVTEDDGEICFDGNCPASPIEHDNVTCEQDASFNGDEYKNVLICRVCLSSDRTLNILGEYSDIYRRLCADIAPDDTKLFLVCWECRALLVHASRFRERAETAHRLLMSEVKPESLSTMSMTTPSILITSCDCNDQEITNECSSFEETSRTYQNDNLNLPVDGNSMKTDEYKEDSKNIEIQYSPPPVVDTEGEDNMDDFTKFDDGWSDDEDLPSEPKRPRRSALNKVKETKENEDDDDDDEEDKISEKSKHSSSESSDSDWESLAPSKPKRKHSKPKPPPFRFRVEVQDYDVDSKITRAPIAESELNHWLESERNSAYFKLSKRKKCHRCVTEILDGENHEKMYHSRSNPFTCDICKVTCSTESLLSSHVAGHYWVLCCSLCSYRCYNQLHMRSHVIWHRKTFRCLECQGAFKSMEEFQQHYEKLHRLAICDYCGKHFPHKLYLETHILRHHVPQECTTCNLKFKSYTGLKGHMEIKHHVERTEAAYCVQCDKQFDNEKLLKRHVYTSIKHASEWRRTYSKPTPQKQTYSCPDCPNIYRSRHSLRAHHRLVHENKIEFYCQQCNKVYFKKSGLQEHMKRIHEGYVQPKNKFCHICGRGFSEKSTLINHIRTHTGERPFACPHPQCDAKFAQKTAMKSHVKHLHEKTPRQQAATSSGNTYNLDDILF